MFVIDDRPERKRTPSKPVFDPFYNFSCSSFKRNKSLVCDSNKAKRENAPFRGFLNAWQFVNFVNVALFARNV